MRTLALAALAALVSTAALAETVVIQRDAPGVVIRERGPAVTGTTERKTVTRTEDANGCGSVTVHKEDGLGNSKTVRKEGC